VDIDIEPFLDRPEQVNIIKDIKARVKAALDEYLRAAERYRLLDLPEDRFTVKEIGIGILRVPPERAEGAFVDADIRIVDVAVNDKGADLLGWRALRMMSAHMPRPRRSAFLNKERASCLLIRSFSCRSITGTSSRFCKRNRAQLPPCRPSG